MTEAVAAVVREAGGKLQIENVKVDDPRGDEVLVRMAVSGVCQVDVGMINGGFYLPGLIGHEGAGVVEKVGERVRGLKPGDRVISRMMSSCGECVDCLTGRPTYCDEFSMDPYIRDDGSPTVTSDGEALKRGTCYSLASAVLTLEKNLLKIPDTAPLEIMPAFACGVMTGAGAVLNTLKPRVGASVAVFGLGINGMSAIMGARLANCYPIIAVNRSEERLARASEFGATHTINSSKEDVNRRIQEIVAGGVDYAIDCVGVPSVTLQALESTHRHHGVLAMIGVKDLMAEIKIPYLSLMDGRRIISTRDGDCIPEIFIPALMDCYKRGLLPVEKLITYYELQEINEGIQAYVDGKIFKCVVKF